MLPIVIASQMFLVWRFKNGNASAGAIKTSDNAQAFIPNAMYPEINQINETVASTIFLSTTV